MVQLQTQYTNELAQTREKQATDMSLLFPMGKIKSEERSLFNHKNSIFSDSIAES